MQLCWLCSAYIGKGAIIIVNDFQLFSNSLLAKNKPTAFSCFFLSPPLTSCSIGCTIENGPCIHVDCCMKAAIESTLHSPLKIEPHIILGLNQKILSLNKTTENQVLFSSLKQVSKTYLKSALHSNRVRGVFNSACGENLAGIYQIVTELEPPFALKLKIFLAGPSWISHQAFRTVPAGHRSLFKGGMK